jgi:hypothetical protein
MSRRDLPTPAASTPGVEAVLKGRYYLEKLTSDGFQKARENLKQSIKIAPDFAGVLD